MRAEKFLNILLFFIFGAILFASGFHFGKGNKIIINPSEKIDFTLFSEVYYLLEENFPEFDNISEEEISYGIIRGLLSGLGDPHTSFFDPQESKFFMENVSGEFGGVGIEIGIKDRNLEVISPIKGTPAYNAGIMSGDIIIAIDDESAENISLEGAVSKIRGKEGDPVKLTVLRSDQIKDFEIIRDTIKIPSLEWQIIEDNIAHIQLFHFNEKISIDFSRVAQEVVNSNAEKIILDMRGNPGGIFQGAISVAGEFIEPRSPVLIETDLKNLNNEKVRTSSAMPPKLLDYPVVILINRGSASASEIVAGAIRDNRDVKIVGEKSYGKGTIQKMHNLSDGSKIKITEKYFLTPNRTLIEKEGIIPDYEIKITEEDREEEFDPQLQKAIDILINNK